MRIKPFARRMAAIVALAAALAWQPNLAHAESAVNAERLARVFQDNMVLQREKPVPVWGWAKAGTRVEVAFGGQKKEATADEHGYWKVTLDAMPADREPQVLTARIGATAATCKNVLVGEVWLAVGHSGTAATGPNVDTGLYPRYDSPGTKGGKPEIRVFPINFGAALEPSGDLDPLVQADSRWKTMKENPEPEELNQVEYFARVIRDRLDVPVGILHPLCVGVCQTAWMSRETLEAFPADSGTGNCYQQLFKTAEAGRAKNAGPIKSWEDFKKAEDQWRLTRKGPWPAVPAGIVSIFSYPSVGYNTRIYPLAPYALRGVQFFACPTPNTAGAAGLVAMVKQWRQLFGQDFYFVNCASGNRFRTITDQPPLAPTLKDNPYEDAMYEALRLFGGEKREEVVNTKDLGSWLAHNFQRAEAGRRLGLTTLALAYGQKLPADGACPRMADTKIQENRAIVHFDLVGDGLVYQPSIDGISGVYARGKDGTVRWAQVKVLSKDTLEISHPDIAELETIAYGESVNSHETLFNSAGLSACPFIVHLPTAKPDTQPPAANKGPRPPSQLVFMQGEGAFHILNNADVKNAQISLAHVRRSGYVFQIVGEETIDNAMQKIAGKDSNDLLEKSSATVPVTAYVPKEWKGVEVMIGDTYYIRIVNGMPMSKGLVKTGGKLVKATETTRDGARFVTFEAPLDRTWIIVAEKGHAAELRKINRY